MPITDSILAAAAVVLIRQDLRRFPDDTVVSAQTYRCKEHVKRLQCYRAVNGWSGGFWDAAIQENDYNLRFWCLLEEARWGPAAMAVGPVWKLKRWQMLHDLLGEERYRTGWHPVCYPENLHKAPTWPELPKEE